MGFIPTRVHGVLDYLTAGVLIGAPAMLGFRKNGMQTWLPMALGVGTIGYSLLTDYELGVVRVLPMPLHLAMDAASGALLASSPWLFGFASEGPRHWVPHVLAGATEMLAAATTRTR